MDSRVIRIDDAVYDLVVARREEMWANGDRSATLTTALRSLVDEALAKAGDDV